jgi:hypothetical protein
MLTILKKVFVTRFKLIEAFDIDHPKIVLHTTYFSAHGFSASSLFQLYFLISLLGNI